MPDPIGIALEWLRFASVVMVGIVAYFLKRSLGDQDDIKKELQELKTKVAVILDRDRRKRMEDYANDTHSGDSVE